MALKAELTEIETNESGLVIDNPTAVLDVDKAVEDWEAYIELCNRILKDEDFQYYKAKVKDETGKEKWVSKRFPKKSAYFKLGRAFNANTEVIEKSVERGKNGQVKEAYYRVRAWLPNNQRVVEADASCDIFEKGKRNASGHDLRGTAETRATNRAIAKLIGAGDVSNEELNSHDMVKISADESKKLSKGD